MNNPSLCIDVSKSSSYASAYLSYNKIYSEPVEFTHTPNGIKDVAKILVELESISGKKPDVVLEDTGNYSKSITQQFQHLGYNVIC